MTDGLGVNSTQTEFTDNLFRANNGDVCTGFISLTGHTWAAWSTDAGQRIGAAVEVEGSGAAPALPGTWSPSINLRHADAFPGVLVSE